MPTLSELYAMRKRLKAQLEYVEREINKSTFCKTCNIQMKQTNEPWSKFGGGPLYQFNESQSHYECPRCKAQIVCSYAQLSERDDEWGEWKVTSEYRRRDVTKFGLIKGKRRVRLSVANMGRS